MKLWKVDIAGRRGITLRAVEPLGNSFVYSHTRDRAAEVFGSQVSSVYCSDDSWQVAIPRRCTVEQAWELRALVLADVEEQQCCRGAVKDALDGIDCTLVSLRRVKKILEAG